MLQSVLYARHSYLVSSGGKLLSNIVTIIVVVLCGGHFGIQAVVAGMLLGNFLQLVVLASPLSTHNFRYHWVLKPFDPKIREVLASFRYPQVGHALDGTGSLL